MNWASDDLAKAETQQPEPASLLEGDWYQGQLQVVRLRCTAVAVGPVRAGPALAVHLRGAIGWSLRRRHCPEPEALSCTHCSDASPCSYRLAFESATGPDRLAPASGHNDWPRAFWLRAPGLPGTIQPGQSFAFELFGAGAMAAALPDVVAALLSVQTAGLGRKHAWFRLAMVETLSLDGAVLARTPHQELVRAGLPFLPQPLRIPRPKEPPGQPIGLTIRFESPMTLRSNRQRLDVPALAPLLGSLGRRVRHLTEHWGAAWDRVQWPVIPAEQVAAVRGGPESVRRMSQSQGNEQALVGFMGEVDYLAEAGHALPWLRLGEQLQAGASTQFGFGVYRITRVW